VRDITVTKTTDKASPTLMRSITAPRDAATGQASGKRQHAR
jgi:type VI protein secretion system component Hcp